MIVEITGDPREYPWGSPTAIPEFLGREPDGRPKAELWLGTHPGAPARLVDREGSLSDVAGELPFLLKVLAAGAPLSLQAHPTPEQARAGFAREEAAGIPRDAPHRNYKDDSAKPELILALEDGFRALCGFRPVAETRAVLGSAGVARLAPLLDRLRDDDDLRDVFRWLLERGPGVDGLVAAVTEIAAHAEGESWAAARLLAAHHPGDPGIAISLLLHAVTLRAGQVLHLPAGNIHAYLAGIGIELMAASDNVLRGGLTSKHVDVPELLEVLDFRPGPVPLLDSADAGGPGARVFATDEGLVLAVVDEDAVRRGVTLAAAQPTIVLATADGLRVRDEGEVVADGWAFQFGHGIPTPAVTEERALERGRALYLTPGTQLRLAGGGSLVAAWREPEAGG